MNSLFNGLKLIMGSIWPIILILSCLFIIGHIYLLSHKQKKVSFFKEIVIWCFIIYAVSLFHIVTSQDVYSIGGVNVTFFKEITRYSFGTNLFYRNIIGNIFLFLPLGFFIGSLSKIKKYLVPMLIGLISLIIESIQLLIGRSFDVDDVLLNLIGGILGYVIYMIINYLLRNIKEEYRDIIIAIILLLAILIIFLIML